MLVTRDKVAALTAVGSPRVDRSFGADGTAASVRAAVGVDFANLLGDLPNSLHCLPCEANWSMHHLLRYLVEKAVWPRVWLTSWTISEAPMRAILQMVDEGLMMPPRCVFDDRVAKQNPNASQLAFANIAHIGLTGIHAKCMVVIGSKRSFTVCSTANITRNKRRELYWICTDAGVAEFHAGWVDDMLKDCGQ
jgi:hypothetical protein